MTTELQIKRKIDDLEIDIRLKPQGPLTSTMQEKIDRLRFDVMQIFDALGRQQYLDPEHGGRIASQKAPARKEARPLKTRAAKPQRISQAVGGPIFWPFRRIPASRRDPVRKMSFAIQA